MATVICAGCGEETTKWPSQIRPRNYCSVRCQRENGGGTVIMKCGWCGKDVRRYRSEALGRRHTFCSRECRAQWFRRRFSGSGSARYKGGYTDEQGYVVAALETLSERQRSLALQMRPGANRIRLHRVIAAESLGRPLLSKERVHHKNGCRNDNRPENLKVYANPGEHRMTHAAALSEIRRLHREIVSLRVQLAQVMS